MKTKTLTRRVAGLFLGFAVLALAFSALSVNAAEIVVTGTADNTDDCIVDTTVQCPSLRSAIIYANDTSPGADSIALGEGTYTLTIVGVDERCETGEDPDFVACTGTGTPEDPYRPVISVDASIGDLDITEDLTIIGAGPDLTIIQWGAAAAGDDDPLTGDRIFHVQTVDANIDSVVFESLAVRNGEVGLVPTDANTVGTPNAYDIEVVNDVEGEVTIWQFRRMGGAISLGAGYAVVLYEQAIHGPGGGGGGAPDDAGPFPGGKPGEEEGFAIGSVNFDQVAILGSWSGADGGGLYNAAPTLIEGSVIGGNEAGANGGGIYNDAELVLIGTTLGGLVDTPPAEFDGLGDLTAGNRGENGGGMFDTGFHTTNIFASSINVNTAIGGGGIAGRALVVINLENSTVSGNVASDVGGGITTNGTVNLRSSTVALNASESDAPGGGGGLNSFGSGTYNLVSTIVAGNTKTAGQGEEPGVVVVNCGCSGGSVLCPEGRMVSLGYNIADDPVNNTCFLDAEGDLTVPTDPLLLALANNNEGLLGLTETHALTAPVIEPPTAGSPAIDAGDNTRCPNTDQRFAARPVDGDGDELAECDIGAYEWLPPALLPVVRVNAVAPDIVLKNQAFGLAVQLLNETASAALVEVLVTLPASGITYDDAASSAACEPGAVTGTIRCSYAAIDAGAAETAELALTGTVATGIGDDPYTIGVGVTSDQSVDPASASLSVRVLGIADVALDATADTPSPVVGENVTVTFTVTNNGEDDATDVRLGGTLPPEVTFVSATPDNGTGCTLSGSDVDCALGNLLVAGPAVDVELVLTIDQTGTATVSAQADAEQSDPDATNNSVSATVTAVEAGTGGGGGGGGGGCSLNPDARIDPVLPALAFIALLALGLRRRVAC